MSYASIDSLQSSLSEQVFAHTKDSKKAAGRALGTIITNPLPEYKPIQNAFLNSYKNDKKCNCFTKVKMNYDSHKALCLYFSQNIRTIENWFNIITPNNKTISDLKQDLYILKNKNWEAIL